MKLTLHFLVAVITVMLLLGFNSCGKKRYTPNSIKVISVNARTALIRGSVPDNSVNKISYKGLCYATHTNPNLSDSVLYEDGLEFDEADIDITIENLQLFTTYYVRMFSKSKKGKIYYGEEKSFTTNDNFAVGDIGPGGGLIYEGINRTDSVKTYHEAIALGSNEYPWGCYGSKIGGLKDLLHWGYWDTEKIINACSQTNTAARICWDLEINGFNDWYLPGAIDLVQINGVFQKTGKGNFANEDYWSCTQDELSPDQNALCVQFRKIGYTAVQSKNSVYRVIAARQF